RGVAGDAQRVGQGDRVGAAPTPTEVADGRGGLRQREPLGRGRGGLGGLLAALEGGRRRDQLERRPGRVGLLRRVAAQRVAGRHAQRLVRRARGRGVVRRERVRVEAGRGDEREDLARRRLDRDDGALLAGQTV